MSKFLFTENVNFFKLNGFLSRIQKKKVDVHYYRELITNVSKEEINRSL